MKKLLRPTGGIVVCLVVFCACGSSGGTSSVDAGPPDAARIDVQVKPFIESMPARVHISHRGGSDTGPENTLEAFEIAVNQFQTDVLEIDVLRTVDGELVLMHDDTVNRTCDATGHVEDMTLAELKTLDAAYRFDPDGDGSYPLRGQGIQVPTLAEAFGAFPDTHFNIEIKSWEPVPFESQVSEVVEAYGMEELVCWGSADDGSAQRLRALKPEVCTYYPYQAAFCFGMTVLNGDDPMTECEDHYDLLSVYDDAAMPSIIEAAHANAIPVWVWTVNDRSLMEDLFGLNVDGILTDRPDILREVINSY